MTANPNYNQANLSNSIMSSSPLLHQVATSTPIGTKSSKALVKFLQVQMKCQDSPSVLLQNK